VRRGIAVLAFVLGAALVGACSVDDQGNLNISFTEQQAPDFKWQGALQPGQTVEIKGISGSIMAEAAPGNQVQLVAKRKGRSDPEKVKIEVVQHDKGVTICAVYPTRPGDEPNVCKPGDEGHLAARNYNVDVTFTVQVPAGVMFRARTTNGSINAQDLKANLDAQTVNGSVKFSVDGYARASTTNGSINGSMARADWTNGLEFSTVNGSIHLQMPDNLQADVNATTVNGRVTVDFPVKSADEGDPRRRHVEGTIGAGGRSLKVSAVNGSVTIGKKEPADS
jgi:DUF4097 and DUF4098 domain-containing protein YvlB